VGGRLDTLAVSAGFARRELAPTSLAAIDGHRGDRSGGRDAHAAVTIERVIDRGPDDARQARSAAECLQALAQTIEGMAKVPRQPRALRLMLEHAQAQIEDLGAAISREVPSVPESFSSDP